MIGSLWPRSLSRYGNTQVIQVVTKNIEMREELCPAVVESHQESAVEKEESVSGAKGESVSERSYGPPGGESAVEPRGGHSKGGDSGSISAVVCVR